MLDERTRRITAANKAMAWGAGGISAVSRACGLSRRVVRRGIESRGSISPPRTSPGPPYGIYDLGRNTGFVNLGTDHDTGAFAVASIRGWWRHEGHQLYSDATTLLITADAGGTNGWRLWLWKIELQRLADDTGLAIAVCHFPPGTSNWNKVDHRLFSFISSNWRCEPLRDYETVVS